MEQSKEKAMSLKKRIEKRKRYCRERGFSFFKGFNQRYKEIKHLFKVKSFQKAYDESLDLISDMEIHIEKKEEEEESGKPRNKVTRIKCPKCHDPITLTSDKRPLEIKCDSCGARGRLR